MNTSPNTSPPLHTRPWSRRLRRAVDAPAHWDLLDTPASKLAAAVESLPHGPYRDALRGVRLGHPLHPLLVQMPLDFWTSAELLDATPGGRRSADALVAAGLLTAAPAALAGWVDWARLDPPRRRTGLGPDPSIVAHLQPPAVPLSRGRPRPADL
ncbi:hypothetical protein ACIBCA_19310 [Kitasatospora sp. NPDC051170]|uniref:hypothetical protein n=1 Tax=Kitasatospora sp. NPDC051170 TaxID=3364056 RepID=UPI0037978447